MKRRRIGVWEGGGAGAGGVESRCSQNYSGDFFLIRAGRRKFCGPGCTDDFGLVV